MNRTKTLFYQLLATLLGVLLLVLEGTPALQAGETAPIDRSAFLAQTIISTTVEAAGVESTSLANQQPILQNRPLLAQDNHLYLPVIYAPQPEWRQISADGRDTNAMALAGNRLYLADRANDTTGGVYYLEQCATTAAIKSDLSKPRIFDVAVRDQRGLAIAFDASTFFSTNSGATWSPAAGNVQAGAYTIAFGQGNVAYAGADGGLYRSTDQGERWELFSQSAPQLLLVNNLWYDQAADQLWIGTSKAGVWRWLNESEGFRQLLTGLDSDQARDVWSIQSTTIATTTYTVLGTSSGVYLRTGNDDATPWSAVGGATSALSGRRVYSLAVNDQGILYAGTSGAGVWQITLNNAQAGAWQRVEGGTAWSANTTVRDLIWAPQLCQGLVAATVDGIWVFR